MTYYNCAKFRCCRVFSFGVSGGGGQNEKKNNRKHLRFLRVNKENYRFISILNSFSKVFERYVLEQLTPFFDKTTSQFLSAYKKNVNCQNVLLRLTEQWRSYLDSNKVVAALLMDLSKALDCLPHDLLLAKLEAYGLDRNTLKLIVTKQSKVLLEF